MLMYRKGDWGESNPPLTGSQPVVQTSTLQPPRITHRQKIRQPQSTKSIVELWFLR